jgi:hypothetical protein
LLPTVPEFDEKTLQRLIGAGVIGSGSLRKASFGQVRGEEDRGEQNPFSRSHVGASIGVMFS